ncbi:hypothetical protein H2200_000399 [Cladophialophora chaetospira]|uniref:Uncharacterized protein n=1 Tax=Cladophialophora chaetospira TaxID=386627 RepID=A0AA38XNC6_9EURO|nr:hypothetical protein H2200_000399 [Cladophialophora chaetospira]
MKYRGSTAHKRFYSGNGEGYSAEDKKDLLKYMHEKGIKRPADVWFNNIKVMLELKADLKGEWMAELQEAMYPNDAQWYIAHMQGMYLALCTTSGPDDEFLLTENAYSIHEGPVSSLIDPDTGKETPMSYTEFHAFAPISPKLIMVLRSNLLPNLEEDAAARIRRQRELMFQATAATHNDPSGVRSLLQDLPVTKARNSYSRFVDGRLAYLEGEDGTPRTNHKYCFRFFPISTEHVNKINCIMLEQSHSISKIAFSSLPAARKTLEHYLMVPCQPNNFKMCGFTPDDPRLIFPRKLEQAVKLLGSDVSAVYRVQKANMDEEEELEASGRMFASGPLLEPTESMKLYARLGGSAGTMPKDLDRSAKMLKLRIKIDVWTQGLDESFREKVRTNLRELFCQLPARRVWYYLKRTRFMVLGGGTLRPQVQADTSLEGPEDSIVTVSQLFRTPVDLCRMMHFATLNGIYLAKHPDFDLAAEITMNVEGAKRLAEMKYLAFESSGSICDCGIAAIEERARLNRNTIQHTRFSED